MLVSAVLTKWISYTYTNIPISPPSCVSLPHSLSHPCRWSKSTKLISLCYAADSQELSISHFIVCISPCHYLTSSQLTLPLPQVLNSILYICIFIPVLPLGSSEPFFFRSHIYVLAYGICFSLYDLLRSVWHSRSIHLTTNNSISFLFMAE